MKQLNARLPASARRVIAVPHERSGRIFLWSPTRRWLEEVVRVHSEVTAAPIRKERTFSHSARWVAAHRLVELARDELSEAERRAVRLREVGWGNRVFYRTTDDHAARVRKLLEALDRRPGTAPRDAATTPRTPSYRTAPRGRKDG